MNQKIYKNRNNNDLINKIPNKKINMSKNINEYKSNDNYNTNSSLIPNAHNKNNSYIDDVKTIEKQTHKKPLLYDEFINPNNILSLENVVENSENFILKAPKIGKLMRGPVCTAYKRQNLGSIPRKTEKILISDLRVPKIEKGFLSQTERFSEPHLKAENVKYLNPGPGAYKIDKKFDFTVNDKSYHSTKGFGNGFASNSSRFEDYKEFYDKYLPGPGSYRSDESTSFISNLNKTLSFKTLYNKAETKPLRVKTPNPGPGAYNPILLNTKIDFVEGVSHYFKSENKRFKNIPKSAIGPGKYFRDDYDKIITKSPNKGSTNVNFFKIVVNNKESHEINPFQENFDCKNKVNLNKTSSYFFKNPIDKSENIINKHIKTTQNVEVLSKKQPPGPGTYEIKKDCKFNWNFTFPEKKESLYVESLKVNKIKKRIHTAVNIKPKPLIDMKLDNIQVLNKLKNENSTIGSMGKTVSEKWFTKNNNINSNSNYRMSNNIIVNNFADQISFQNRFSDNLLKKNIPGPAYYNPKIKPIKVNFNWNLEKKWI